MSREFKFRVWDNEQNKYALRVNSIIFDLADKLHSVNVEDITHSRVQILSKNIIVEQYIGIKDKNGKEIYEGDIIKLYKDGILQGLFEVIYDCDWCSFRPDLLKANRYFAECEQCFPKMHYRYMVVGNIHENKELLEEK